MTYKLYYFNARGLAEPIRYMLKYGNIEFEDIRVERGQWRELKETMPMGCMPVLEIDDRKYPQSVSIARYVGRKVGLAGSDELEDLEIDSVVDTFMDLRSKLMSAAFMHDGVKKLEAFSKLKNETLPFYLSKLNTLAEANDGHLACQQLTWADFFVAGCSGMLKQIEAKIGEEILANYPALVAVVDNVESIDVIKNWIHERPVTEM